MVTQRGLGGKKFLGVSRKVNVPRLSIPIKEWSHVPRYGGKGGLGLDDTDSSVRSKSGEGA